MAEYYCYNGGDGTTGTSWATAEQTLTAALASTAAGDTVWVAHDHTESTAGAVTLAGAGTAASPVLVICVDRGVASGFAAADLRTTAAVNTTASNNLTISGSLYIEGIIFTAGDATGTGQPLCSGALVRLKNCAMRCGGTGGASIRLANASTGRTICDNVTLQFASTAQNILNVGTVIWRNTPSAITGATIPTTLFSTACTGYMRLEGVDLSAAGSGKTLFGAVTGGFQFEAIDCKFEDDATKHAAITTGAADFKLIRCSETTNYKFERFNFFGDETTETTIVRTGGSTDGTQAFSKKIVTTANAKPHNPFASIPIEIWNDVEDVSRTLTVYGIWGGGAVPNNNDIWIEVDYLGDATSPQFSRVSSGLATVLSTASATSASSQTWGGSTTDFEMSVAFTPAQKGPVHIRVLAGAASSTFYICGKPSLANT